MDPIDRMFLAGVFIPVIAALIAWFVIWPDSLGSWLLLAVVPFVASTAVALYYGFKMKRESR